MIIILCTHGALTVAILQQCLIFLHTLIVLPLAANFISFVLINYYAPIEMR